MEIGFRSYGLDDFDHCFQGAPCSACAGRGCAFDVFRANAQDDLACRRNRAVAGRRRCPEAS